MSSISGPILFAPLLKVWVPGGRHPVRYDFTCVAFFPLYQKCRSDVSSCAAALPLSQILKLNGCLPFLKVLFPTWTTTNTKARSASRQPHVPSYLTLAPSDHRHQRLPSITFPLLVHTTMQQMERAEWKTKPTLLTCHNPKCPTAIRAWSPAANPDADLSFEQSNTYPFMVDALCNVCQQKFSICTECPNARTQFCSPAAMLKHCTNSHHEWFAASAMPKRKFTRERRSAKKQKRKHLSALPSGLEAQVEDGGAVNSLALLEEDADSGRDTRF